MINPFEGALRNFILQSDENVNTVLPTLGTLARQDADEEEAFAFTLNHFHLDRGDFTDSDWKDMQRLYRKERNSY